MKTPARTTRDLPIELDRSLPLHRALYAALRDAMLHGRLQPGARLPSTRDLGRQLDVSRGTVVAVYAQLASEGYLAGRVGAGTVVAAQLPDRWFAAPPQPATGGAMRREPPLSSWGRGLVSTPFGTEPRRAARPFRAHIPAVDEFPGEVWGRLLARRARRDERLLLGDADIRGYAPLRALIAEHLRVARGVVCSADQVVIVPSTQQVLDLVARLVLDPGDRLWLEDPGYPGARAIAAAVGAEVVPVPVDDDGLDVAAGIRLAPTARLAYVTPGRQSPLGVTMTLERRVALLAWAAARGSLILEDDYDSEYRYEGRPVPALQGLDGAGVVVHTGTFSKTLLSSLRLGYVVVPDGLLDRFVAAKSIIDRFTPPLAQAVLADFIEGGHFGRHLRRMREVYAERRVALLTALERELGDAVRIAGAHAGLDLTLRLAEGSDDAALGEALAAAGLEALPLSTHVLRRRDVAGFVLGFAAFSPARLRRSAAALARVLAG